MIAAHNRSDSRGFRYHGGLAVCVPVIGLEKSPNWGGAMTVTGVDLWQAKSGKEGKTAGRNTKRRKQTAH